MNAHLTGITFITWIHKAMKVGDGD